MFGGSFDSVPMRELYICCGVPAKQRPQPPMNSVSPVKIMRSLLPGSLHR